MVLLYFSKVGGISCKLKEVVVERPLLEKPSLGLANLNNYKLMFNIPYLVKVVKKALLQHPQELLETIVNILWNLNLDLDLMQR